MKRKLVSSLIALLLLLLGVGYVNHWFTPDTKEGSITLTIQELDETIYYEETLPFDENETLFELLSQHFEIGCASASYTLDVTCSYRPLGGPIILKIGSLETNWTHTYFALYRNGSYATIGVGTMILQDQDQILLKVVAV